MTTSTPALTSTGKPLSRKTSIMRWFSGSTIGGERRDAALACGVRRQMGEQRRRQAAALVGVGDRERHLGVGALASRT